MRILMLVLMCVVVAGPVSAQDKAAEMSPEEMMKMYEKAAQPCPQHAMLAQRAGKWDCTVRSWHDPQGEPEVSEGTETAELIFDGRYIVSRFKGSMMGRPYEGMGTMGYDNGKKKFVGTWFDSMSTGIMAYEGDYDSGSKQMVMHGSYVDPLSGKETTTRMVTRMVSDDQTVFEMFGPGPTGNEVKWMEITYNRAK